MATKDPRIDAYIAKSQVFAQPIMKHLRDLIHKACPDVLETIKWGMPSFDYKGPMFNFAAFKQHCAAGFWKSKLLVDKGNYLGERKNQGGEAMGNMGRLTSLKDLPPDNVLIDFIKQHMKLNEAGVKVEKKPAAKKQLIIPAELTSALAKSKKAKATFEKFSESGKREYVNWISEAKTEATRTKRIVEAIQWMEEGKPRLWKYMKEFQK